MGALKEQMADEKLFELSKIERIGGTSAGAIAATLLGCGYDFDGVESIIRSFDVADVLMDSDLKENYAEIEKLLNKTQKLFKTFGIVKLGSLFLQKRQVLNDLISRLSSNSGLFPGEKFRNWIDEKISRQLDGKKLEILERVLRFSNPESKLD